MSQKKTAKPAESPFPSSNTDVVEEFDQSEDDPLPATPPAPTTSDDELKRQAPTENVMAYDNAKPASAFRAGSCAVGVPLSFIRFVGGVDFPGVNEEYITCSVTMPETGRGYRGTLLPELGAVEIVAFANGAVVKTKYVPLLRVKDFEIA